MKSDEYKYLEETLLGKRARDVEFESRMSTLPEGSISEKAAERQRQLDSKTAEERELEQREFSLTTYGKFHMEKYSRPIVSDRALGRLQTPGDQIVGSALSPQGHNGKMEAHKSASPQLKGHSAERPGPWRDKNGKPILQNHSACPIKQVLKVY